MFSNVLLTKNEAIRNDQKVSKGKKLCLLFFLFKKMKSDSIIDGTVF
ncbi:hypothetical protein D922_00759 [Enterococcus faecalis 06-MB-DW-09]|nr:hypothetical protein D922_00759 [Enterococcus faecalis 06-MB-DW-09]